jgi:HTH-type transcriptional regulator / antitoxin HigA
MEKIMPLTIDRKTYGRLLAKEAPARITNDAEHAAALERTKEILLRENEATPEELAYLDLLATLIEDYERNRWPLKREECSPRELLAFLLEENGLKQTDLSDIAPQSNISAILAGKRPIGAATAVKLGKRFHVSPELFLEI